MKKKIVYPCLGAACLIGAGLWVFWPEVYSTVAKAEEMIEQTIAGSEETEEPEEENPLTDSLIKISKSQAAHFGIQIQEAGPGELQIHVSTRGTIILQPDGLAHIIPKVAGMADEALKNIGDKVKLGEPLAILESREMAEIKADYLSALEKQKLTKSELDRETRLRQRNITSEEDFIKAKSAYEEARITVQLGQNKLRIFGLQDHEIAALADMKDPDLRKYVVHSPLAGTVIKRHITKGEFIENTAVIYEIANLDTVWVDIGIYPKDLVQVKEGQRVEIVMPAGGKSSEATLIYLSPIIQQETITARAIAELKNPEKTWRPGTYVKVNIAVENIEAPLIVPKDAIQNIDAQDCVFVETNEGFEKRPIRRGKCDTQNTEVISGLQPGEKYAATHTFLLKAELGKNTMEPED